MENTEYKIWKTRSTKYGKHGVQNMENTEYKIWKTRSLTLNMENTECDIKNMEWTYCQREIWKTVSELLCNNTMQCVVIYANLNKQIQIQYKPIDALFRCKIDLYNRGYKADFFSPVTVYYLAYMCFQICTFCNFCREVGQLSGDNTEILSVTLFQFNSRILVEDFAVGTCNSCM